jgi:membrane fusion protein, multidrug efflux system
MPVEPTAEGHTARPGQPTRAASSVTARLRARLRGSPRARAFLVVVVVAALVGAFTVWRHYAVRESTDDAEVDGHITPIAARIGGTIQAVSIHDNQLVEAGTVLVEIDPSDYQLALARAEAELAGARAEADAARMNVPITSTSTASRVSDAEAKVRKARAGVASATARLALVRAKADEAKANLERAEHDLERFQPLVAKEEVSRQEFDAVDATAKAARAADAAAGAAVDEAEHGLQEAEQVLAQAQAERAAAATAPDQVAAAKAREAAATARFKHAQAAVEQARLNLAYTKVVAPARGVISKKSVEVGQVVQPGQPLMALVLLDDIWITANFKETQVRHMHPGQIALVSVDAYGRTYRGHVDSISPATAGRFSLLPAENASGNYVKVVQRLPVKIVLDEGQDTEHLLRPGMSVVPTVITR